MDQQHRRGPAALPPCISVRRDAVASARHDLAICVVAEEVARRALLCLEREIAQQTERAVDPASGDAAVESFAAWLTEARRCARTARNRLDDAEADTACARASLSLCRAALQRAEATFDLVAAGRPAWRRLVLAAQTAWDALQGETVRE